MPTTIVNGAGDGEHNVKIESAVELPDSGRVVKITGTIDQPDQLPSVSLTPPTLEIPAAPGSGSIFYILQANKTTGVVTIKESTSGLPVPDEGNFAILSQTLISTSTDPALIQAQTPDE